MRIIYLDQNKWIDLARAAKYPEKYPELRMVLETLVREAKANRIIVPLTQANIYETHKIVDPERRHDLAYTQATLSQGKVFRGRQKRLEAEVIDVMRRCYNLEPRAHAADWFLSDVFFESTLNWDDPRFDGLVSERVYDEIKKDPPRFLFEYLMNTTDEMRTMGTKNFTEGSEKLKQLIEERRKRDAGESLSMRRRIYSATLLVGELDRLLAIAAGAQLPTQDENEILRACTRKLVTDAPIYFIEREITLKIEAQPRPVTENDFRDMQTFCAVLPYADVVVAEKNFTNMARQAGLDRKYNTRATTDLMELNELLK